TVCRFRTSRSKLARGPGGGVALADVRQRAREEGREGLADFFHAGVRLTERGELRHLQPRVAAGIDALETFEVHVHVECEAVVARPAADADADAADLAAVHVHAGRARLGRGLDAEAGAVFDDRGFHGGDQIAYAETHAADVDEWIDHELAGSVVRDLP